MTEPRGWTDDRLERELGAWFRARQAPPAPATLRAFAAEVASRSRAKPLAGRRSIAWRGGPASRLAVAATIVAAIVVTGSLLLVAGQRGPAGPTSSPPGSLSTPSPLGSSGPTSTSPAPTGSPSTAPSEPTAAEVPACDPPALTAVAGRSGETGVVQISVLFTNGGGQPCSLPGVPAQVALLRSNGRALDLQTEPPLGDPAARVVLRPGVENDAGLIAYWANWCAKDPGPLDVRVTFTAGGGSVETRLVGPLVARCDAPTAPSSIRIDSISAATGQTEPWWVWPPGGGVTMCGVVARYRIDGGPPVSLGNCAGMLLTTPTRVMVHVGQEVDLHMTTDLPVGASPPVPRYPLPPSPDDAVLQRFAVEDAGATGSYRAVAPGEVVLTTSGLCTDLKAGRQAYGACPVLDVTVTP
jgi:Domain of unknown function (DUF4232)